MKFAGVCTCGSGPRAKRRTSSQKPNPGGGVLTERDPDGEVRGQESNGAVRKMLEKGTGITPI